MNAGLHGDAGDGGCGWLYGLIAARRNGQSATSQNRPEKIGGWLSTQTSIQSREHMEAKSIHWEAPKSQANNE